MPPATITIHYHRFDALYDGLSLWTWDAETPGQPPGIEVLPAGTDDFGPYFRLDPADYGATLQNGRVGFIPRFFADWNRKDGNDRFWTPLNGREIWLVGGDPFVYTDRPDTAPRVQYAFLDGERLVTLRLTHGMTLGRLVPQTFQVKSADGPVYPVNSVRAVDPYDGKARTIEIMTVDPPDLRHELIVLADGYRPIPAVPRKVLFDPGKLYADVELGAIHEAHRTTFRVFAPSARAVDVLIYDHHSGKKTRVSYPMTERGMGIWEATVRGDLDGKYYTLRADSAGQRTCREATDIHSRCNTGLRGHGRIVNLRKTDPEGFRPVARPPVIQNPTDAIIYEVSVRDFTTSPHSGVPAPLRGKYLGAAQRGTLLPASDIRTGIDHLVELGVTHVQLLPVQDFDTDEETPEYNWGYMTQCFNSPEGWYASNRHDDARVRELKVLIKAFHDAGIRVVLDVVYNHTSPHATFDALAPGYYYRLKPDGSHWNGSGCGNEFRSEAPMARKFIVDSCLYWVNEFGVDGFRFDLMGLIDLETLKAVRDAVQAVDPTILVYGEPWAAAGQDGCGIERITYKDVVAGSGIGAFNDHFRNAIKGAPDGPEPGYVQTGEGREKVKRGIEGSIRDWARHPAEAIQYVTCHDNLTLWDKLALSLPKDSEEDRLKVQALCAGILAVSQGVMFLHGGHELARTKYGHHNSYNLGDEINRIEWERKAAHPDLFATIRGYIALRKAHPVFRLATREEVEARLQWRDDLCASEKCLAFELKAEGIPGESWKRALVYINPEPRDLEFKVPAGNWSVFVQGAHTGLKPLFKTSDLVFVPERGLVVMAV